MRSASAFRTNGPVPAAEPAVAPADEAAGALADRELASLFAPLAEAQKIALAVSGGPDSLALLDAVARWRQARGGRPDAVVLTVDHRLQAGSDAIAERVLRIAEARGLPARILVREGPPPANGIEDAARTARYRLLLEACREEGATHLVLAHHRDDVAETFLMRLKRGSGVFGLAAMRPQVESGGIAIVRPFLDVSRSRLAATVAAAGLEPVADPMNDDPRFARTRIRRFLARSPVDPAVFATLAARFADLADAIDVEATGFFGDHVAVDAFAVAHVDVAALSVLPQPVRLRALARLLMAIGGGDYAPRSDRLGALDRAIADGATFRRTLAGVVLTRRAGSLVLYRESGRGLPTMPLAPGAPAVWDGRYAVTLGPGFPAGLTVGPLGDAGRREVGAISGDPRLGQAPVAAVAGIPAVRDGDRIVAAPVFREDPGGEATFRPLVAERLARPRLFPDFAAG